MSPILKTPKNIKELLKIDIDWLYQNAVFKADLITDADDSRNFLLFDLKTIVFDLFDQFQISMFNKKASHLEFIAKNPKPDQVYQLIERIVNAYGADENNQNAMDFKSSKHMSWWFKNNSHEQSYDEPKSIEEDIYYGILVDGMAENQLILALVCYENIDPKLNEKDWLQ